MLQNDWPARARPVPSGGRPATQPDGRAAMVDGGSCRAVIDDRRGRHQCRRRGWFALLVPDFGAVAPLCATHLRQLARAGGAAAA